MKITSILWIRNKNNKNEKEFTIMVRYWNTDLKKYIYTSTGFKVSPSYFVNGKVTNKNRNHIQINERIDEIIEDIKTKQFKVKNKIQDELNKSFLQYYQNYIDLLNINKVRLKKTHKTILLLLKKYVEDIKGWTDLQFEEITNDELKSFVNYLSKRKGRKKIGIANSTLANSTIHGYIKKFRTVYFNYVENNEIHIVRNPFKGLITLGPTESHYLNLDQIEVLEKLNPKYIDTKYGNEFSKNTIKTMFEVRNYFLFQFFSWGMRVSDTLCLKWSNINGRYLTYTMSKTQKRMSITLHHKLVDILKFYLPFKYKLIYLTMIYDNELLHYISDDEYKEYLEIVGLPRDKGDLLYKNKPISKKEKIYLEVLNKILIRTSKSEFKKDFIFPLLKVEDEKKIKTKSDAYNLISSKTTIYNKKLKELNRLDALDLDFNLTTHVARHSFSNFIREKGCDISYIKEYLGHNDISVTQNYLKTIPPQQLGSKIGDYFDVEGMDDIDIKQNIRYDDPLGEENYDDEYLIRTEDMRDEVDIEMNKLNKFLLKESDDEDKNQ